ncbi:hypothetical protein ACBZ91_04495 [Vibrio natriegens]|jgi:hypothetical protein|uniref:hypothetical protein n=1 Tax=Vibrio natriegens TaxID=691 RepID=UPI00355818ED
MYLQFEKRTDDVSAKNLEKRKVGNEQIALVDNRDSKHFRATNNTESPNFLQLRASKIIEYSARRHYKDGWGAKYAIQTDDALRTKVPDGVKNDGEIHLGFYDTGRSWYYKGEQYKKVQKCNILYKDIQQGWGKYKSKSTSIYHCGPTGSAITRKV